MFYLFWDSDDFGHRFKQRAEITEIRAKYDTVEAAIAQAEYDLKIGRHPLRIEDEEGLIIWTIADA